MLITFWQSQDLRLCGCVVVCVAAYVHVRVCVYTLTALSMPKVSSMMKKITAQTEDPGNVAMASG